MKTTRQQKEILDTLFTGEKAVATPQTETAEYVIPVWQRLAPTYAGAVKIVLDRIKETRPLYNWRDGQIDDAHLRETDRKREMMAKYPVSEDGRYVTISAQMGPKYKGKSVKEVRTILGDGEFGLGAFETGCILLANPDILKSNDDLYIDCPGDEFSPDGGGAFSRAPLWLFHGDRLRFDAGGVSRASDFYGSASGFSPQ